MMIMMQMITIKGERNVNRGSKIWLIEIFLFLSSTPGTLVIGVTCVRQWSSQHEVQQMCGCLCRSARITYDFEWVGGDISDRKRDNDRNFEKNKWKKEWYGDTMMWNSILWFVCCSNMKIAMHSCTTKVFHTKFPDPHDHVAANKRSKKKKKRDRGRKRGIHEVSHRTVVVPIPFLHSKSVVFCVEVHSFCSSFSRLPSTILISFWEEYIDLSPSDSLLSCSPCHCYWHFSSYIQLLLLHFENSIHRVLASVSGSEGS